MRGRIQRALSGFYYVKCADGQLYTCKARGKFRKEGVSPLVGDDVEFCEVPGGEGRIDEISNQMSIISNTAGRAHESAKSAHNRIDEHLQREHNITVERGRTNET